MFISGEDYFNVKELEIYTIESVPYMAKILQRVQSLEHSPNNIQHTNSHILENSDINFLEWCLGERDHSL